MKALSKIDLFFYLNLFCNDKCNFCFFSKLPPRENFLTLESVKKVIHEVGEDKIRGMILTGGEPTLNPHFLEIIEYIHRVYLKTGKIKEFDLSTNAITSADKQVAERLEKYFSPFGKNNPDIKISFSFSSFQDLSEKKITEKKIQGIRNLIKINSNIECVITITKDNYQRILEATQLLLTLAKKRTKKYFFKIDYRLPYTSMMYSKDDLERIIVPFDSFSKVLNRTLNMVREANIYTTLHNIPLCYIRNKPAYFLGRKPPRGIAVFPDRKSGFIKRKKQFRFGKMASCFRCRLKNQCDGIEKIYLDKYNYLKFKLLSNV